MLNSSGQLVNKWDVRFLSVAALVSSWSKDPRTQVGACITKGKKLISVGYNGFPLQLADTPERLVDREKKNNLVVHAENNAILAAQGVDTQGATLYVFGQYPCHRCAITCILPSGIERVVVGYDINHTSECVNKELSESILNEAGIQVVEVYCPKP